MAPKAPGSLQSMVLIDTDVLIEISRARVEAGLFLRNLGSASVLISSVVAMEFLIGSRDRQELQRAAKQLRVRNHRGGRT